MKLFWPFGLVNEDGLYDRLDPALGFGITQISRANGVTTITWAARNGPVNAGAGQLSLSTTDTTALTSRFYRVRLLN